MYFGELFQRIISDPTKHGFRISTFEENKQSIHQIFHTIKENNPNAKVVFTVSPVPLLAYI